jgi:FkbM family methyltransferase
VIDVGANIGTFAVLAACASTRAMVHCYEPSPDACRLLRRNAALNGVERRIIVNEVAVAGSTAPLWLECTPQSSLRSISRGEARAGGDRIQVRALTLAAVFAERGISWCDFLKLDCEGAEYEILRACPPELLDRIGRIALEYHDWGRGQDHRELLDILRGRGFDVEHADDPFDPRVGYLFADRKH